MEEHSEYVVGVELGDAWVSCLVAAEENGELNVLGGAREPCSGFHRGELVDLDAAARAIEAAVRAAEEGSYVHAQTVFIGAASLHYRGLNSRGCVHISREDRIVTEDIRRKAVEAAERVSLPNEREIVDAIPQSFTLDEMRWVANPVGMTGSRLEAEVHLATDGACYLSNVAAAVEKTHCQAEGIVFKPLAAAEAVLTDDEKRLGCVAIDIGAAMVNYILFRNGAPRYSAVLPIGGRHVTNDIAVCLNMPIEQAEQMKTTHACASRTLLKGGSRRKLLEVRTPNRLPQTVSRGRLCAIVECRIEEVFTIIRTELARAGYGDSCHAGAVITGGAAKLPGVDDVARRVFGRPARVGRPHVRSRMGQQLEDPAWAACVGVLRCGLRQRRLRMLEQPVHRNSVSRFLSKGIDWARAAF